MDDIVDRIEQCYNEGKIDDNQYNNLKNKANEVKEKIENGRRKLKDPENYVDVDIFALLNGQIDGLAAAISALENQIDGLEAPIKDKEVRKKIDKEFERLENEIKTISDFLELYKDKDPEKYEAAVKRLEEQKQRLDEIAKKYRKKCPFLVRTAKSAKEFYKKHKKLVLLAAGLAAIALVHATIGPVIIPAIMHGNLLIGHSIPAFRGILGGINKVLGTLINAKVVDGVWVLANGIKLAPSCASASLLKAIALAGVGTAAWVTPLVFGTKKLFEKMNLAKHRENVSTDHEKDEGDVEKTTSDTVDRLKEEVGEIKSKITGSNKHKKQVKATLEEIKKMLEEYKKSGLPFDEFCNENNLSDEDKILLEALDKKVGGR